MSMKRRKFYDDLSLVVDYKQSFLPFWLKNLTSREKVKQTRRKPDQGVLVSTSNFSLVSRYCRHREYLIGRQTEVVAGLFADRLFMDVKTERVTVYVFSVYLTLLDSLDKRRMTVELAQWLFG